MPPQTSSQRRVAVVTGGNGAIGGDSAARLARDHEVVVLDRASEIAVDLVNPDDVRRAAELVLARYGRCDVLVHSAAMVAFGAFETYDIERLIHAAGFDPLKIGGAASGGRIEAPGGDLHQFALNDGQVVDLDQARAALAGAAQTA